MRLTDWAKKQGIGYLTAWRWFHAGTLPVKAFQTISGSILVEDTPIQTNLNQVWIYARVSSHDKKDDLERQTERCSEFCRARGWEIQKVIKEIGSGMNDSRPKLLKLLSENPSRIVVEHKDRLTRFGFKYFEVLLPKLGCELIVINRDPEEATDLMKDLVSVITSFCCRLYGLRRGQGKIKQIKEVLTK